MTSNLEDDEFLGIAIQERQRLASMHDKIGNRITALDAVIEAYSDDEESDDETLPVINSPTPLRQENNHGNRIRLESALADQPQGRYTEEETDIVAGMRKKGHSVKEIAAKLGREYASVYAKSKALGY